MMNAFKPIHFFIHPWPLLAVALTALNDHYLKAHFANWLTGKISDFAGLFYFPLFLAAVIVLTVRIFRKNFVFNKSLLVSAILFTDLVFCLLKLNVTAQSLFVNWFSKEFFLISVTRDITDIVALFSNVVCYFFARQFFATDYRATAE